MSDPHRGAAQTSRRRLLRLPTRGPADVDVTVERVIAAPREEVAGFAGDPTRAPEWYANIRSVEWRTEPPVAVGSRMDFVAHFLGRRLAYTYEVTELVPGERLVMRTADGPFPMQTTYTWADAAGGTRMTLTNTGRPSGFAGVTAPLMSAAMRRATTKDLERLAGLLEPGVR
ncbi:MAG TPA: SRPBCC family protein [Nocardioides sp.]|nr:SRPBCC family protein [Nocardioides sp.]